MTAYNREKYIAEAIESVLSSEYKNFELLIADDGSTDATVDIIKRYAAQDERIFFWQNAINLGDYQNRNFISTKAKGEYLLYVDSDDKIFPDTLSYCLEEVSGDPEIHLGMFCMDPALCNKVLNPAASLQQHFFVKPFLQIGPGGTFLKRSFFERIGRYPTKYGPANDLYFNLKAACTGNIKLLCKEFLFYRIHEGQEQNNKFSYLYNNFIFLRDALAELNLPLTAKQKKWLLNKARRRFVVNLLRFTAKSRNFTKSRQAVKLANFSIYDAAHGLFHYP